MLIRIHELLALSAPIQGVGLIDPVQPPSATNIRIDFDASATAQQIIDANAALAAMDFSQGAHDTWLNGKLRQQSAALLSAIEASPRMVRALLIEMVKELNRHSTLEDDIFAATAAATSLADFKSRMAAITTRVPQRTKANLITAITAAINAGEADA